MNERYTIVPLAHDESALPIGTISYSQFVLSDMSHGTEYKTVRLTDDQNYVRAPMVLSDSNQDY